MDKLQEQKNNFVAYQQETASAIADRDKAIERLKAELKALGDRLETKTQELVNAKRNVSVLEMQLRDATAEVQVRLLSQDWLVAVINRPASACPELVSACL